MLNEFSIQQLKQLEILIHKMDDSDYANLKDPVFGSTVGKHVRHIIEFYQEFFKTQKKGKILSYDKRKRNLAIEKDATLAISKIQKIIKKLNKIPDEKDFLLKCKINDESYYIQTTISREIMYLNEHTTHHLAFIQLLYHLSNPKKEKISNLGVAYSTPKAALNG